MTAFSEKKGHPAGLYFLFFTEMWERFSYYGMRSLLVYYMMKQLMFSQEHASSIYGLYTGLVYFTPFFGGILADRYLGQRKTVFLGGIIMAIGHFLMAVQSLFYPAMAFLIIGCGAFKPNISTQVGGLYEAGDPRRDRAYSIFYMGINLGAFFSPLVCGTLGEVFGWHWGFGAAGVGMLLGLAVYTLGQKHLAPDQIMLNASRETAPEEKPLGKDEASRICALVILFLFTIVFWATYEQQGNTLALWADANTNRMIFGWEMPASWFQSLNPMFIFLFIPIINVWWSSQAKRAKEPSSITKMAIGCILLGISFLVMIPPSHTVAGGAKVNMLWLGACIAILTVGEIYLSPIGLSLVTKVAPVRMVSMLMGMWFLASFLGNYLSGYLGTFWEKMPKESFFILLSALSIGAGLGILLVNKPLKRAMTRGQEGTADI
ncbi:MAG TPA: peptide MFS transporter [Candidatus Hydrogenedentes bacterium]|nr:peptide MFS transporter [Candidatus Hydrogenedentota bacterium]